MTILPEPLSPVAQDATESLLTAASAVAGVLPSPAALTPATPKPGDLGSTAGFAGAAMADFGGTIPGAVAVLVGPELVTALESSPLGSLDLAAAAQPALDAAAKALGGHVGAARSVPVDLVINDLGFPFTVVPLVGAGAAAALLVLDESLGALAAQASQPEPVAAPDAPVPAFGGAPNFANGQGAPSAPMGSPVVSRGLEMLHGVIMDVTVELGRTRMSVRDLLALTPGTVLELDRAAGSPADLLVNGRLIARGEVVVVDEDFGLRVTEIVDDASAA
ncbi:flagellar motor switch protein FliN [Nocardioides caldifontis]|uniref:flagellar motor switch protein FliN n=1 Tax=Nocardioides caldifontis TaxID=2588938 RepID=UPI0011DF6C77|nr:flagellar motor switch protein FliN [Nocardioides caldifontis]